MTVFMKATALWLSILVLAILNGTLRQNTLIPAFGDVIGFVASGAILSICIFLVALASAPWYGPLASTRWLLVGACWLSLTLAFELVFGRLIQHKPWAELLAAYQFKDGNIWPVVLLITLLAPWLAAHILDLTK